MNNNTTKRNYGYLCGILMALLTVLVTALIVFLSWNEISSQITSIFDRNGFWNITKDFFTFLGNISSKLKFGMGMKALSYLDLFCLGASILGFVQGASNKK
ncbi:MAG: hypothetical protein J6B80_01495 [Clostridia bacterium]|nr:hypothetical protein [Clostridia bacterium]